MHASQPQIYLVFFSLAETFNQTFIGRQFLTCHIDQILSYIVIFVFTVIWDSGTSLSRKDSLIWDVLVLNDFEVITNHLVNAICYEMSFWPTVFNFFMSSNGDRKTLAYILFKISYYKIILIYSMPILFFSPLSSFTFLLAIYFSLKKNYLYCVHKILLVLDWLQGKNFTWNWVLF